MSAAIPKWLVLAWRLPTGSSTRRVNTWRSLRRLGAAGLTPGAAVVPYREELQEQLDWLAQEIEEQGGDAWVLPVTELSEKEERRVVGVMRAERAHEYEKLREEARDFLHRAPEHPEPDGEFALRLRTERELLALQRRFGKIRARDYFDSPGRREAALMVDRCLAFRQGISAKLRLVTDEENRDALRNP
jgi:hypothetical protein